MAKNKTKKGDPASNAEFADEISVKNVDKVSKSNKNKS